MLSRLLLLAGFVLAGLACSPVGGPIEGTARVVEAPTVPARAPAPPVHYVALGPRDFADELEPLLALRRSQGLNVVFRAVEDVYTERNGGKPKAETLREEILAIAKGQEAGALKFVLLAGDPLEGPATIPSFFSEIGDWRPGGFEVRPHRTDHDFAVFDALTLAVGRLPARTEAELTTMVKKVVAYESAAAAGAWQRRVLVFGGPADFGPIADGALEAQATALLDELLPYDFDVGVIFAKSDSPYVYRYDQLGTKIIEELNEGSLLAVYAGHGLEDSFDRAKYRGMRYPIGSVRELESLNIEKGSPIFVSLTCLTGDYGRPSLERSIAETMILHPKGPVAVFASSDVSHPYPNLLYAQALLESFILKRSRTVGEGIVAAKHGMLDRSIPFASLLVPGDHDKIKAEHLTLYNLLGDPATPVRLPLPATVDLPVATVGAGKTIKLNVNTGELGASKAVVTIETERSALKPGLVSASEIEAMPLDKAFETMAKNYEIASDKVVSATRIELGAGGGAVEIVAPKTPGRYVVKVLLENHVGVASGHARFEVQP